MLSPNMLKEKFLLDIRYFESDVENVNGASLPDHTGRIYAFPASIHSSGARIARKLREYGFTAGPFDHLYVNYTPLLPEREMQYAPRSVEPWIKYVDFGLAPENTNRLSDMEKESVVVDSTFEILRFIASDRQTRCSQIERVCGDIKAKGTELEIHHTTKETASYVVTVTFQIEPKGNQSVGLIEYHERRSGRTLKGEFVRLNHYEDIFSLVGTISVRRGLISLKPRSSFKASLNTKPYQVPIEIPITALAEQPES